MFSTLIASKGFFQIHNHLLSRTASMAHDSREHDFCATTPLEHLLLTKSPLRPRFFKILKEKRSTQNHFSFTSPSPASSRTDRGPQTRPDALEIPISRSRTVTSIHGIVVWWKRVEVVCTATRTVLSFLHVGSFEAPDSPASLFFIDEHWQPPLSECVGRRLLRLEGIEW